MKVKDQFHFPASNLICRYGPLCNHEIFNRRISEDGKRWCADKWDSLQNGSNLLRRLPDKNFLQNIFNKKS